MSDRPDYDDLGTPHDEALLTPSPAPRPPSPVPLIVGTLIVVALGAAAYYFLVGRDTAVPDTVASGPEAPGAPAGEPTAPALGAEPEAIDLPPLEETDALVRRLAAALSSHPHLAAWLATDGLIRNFVVVVENIAFGTSPGAVRLEIRVEAFNLLDRANFTAPNGNRSSAAFGTITSTYDPRQLQLGVKVLWN